jgi:hypothetical protein
MFFSNKLDLALNFDDHIKGKSKEDLSIFLKQIEKNRLKHLYVSFGEDFVDEQGSQLLEFYDFIHLLGEKLSAEGDSGKVCAQIFFPFTPDDNFKGEISNKLYEIKFIGTVNIQYTENNSPAPKPN